MCDAKLLNSFKETKMFSKRSSLWDLPAHYCCPIIGTCLDVAQLKKIRNRFSDDFNASDLKTDYELHSYFVNISSNKNQISVYINKLLNKQYLRYVNDVNKLKIDDDIEAAWRRIVKSDLLVIAGYFWAIMSSKYSSEKLKNKIYGEVHMISHIAGQDNNSELKKLRDDKKESVLLLAKKQRFIDDKNIKLEKQRVEIKHLKEQNSQVLFQKHQLQLRQDDKGLSAKDYERLIASQQFKITSLQNKLDALEEFSTNKILENKTSKPLNLENVVMMNEEAQCDGVCVDCDNSDLCGKKILYVGGFSRHRRKLQRMTNDINGKFFYHDGGKQQSEHVLDDMVKKVDCVFCPVDCISHSAIGRIKTLAKTHCIDCVFLRSASLSSFDAEIKRYAS